MKPKLICDGCSKELKTRYSCPVHENCELCTKCMGNAIDCLHGNVEHAIESKKKGEDLNYHLEPHDC